MKICWDNIENIRLSKRGLLRDIVKKQTYYIKICPTCNNEYFGLKNAKFCCRNCKRFSKETKEKMSNSHKGKILSESHKENIGNGNRGKKYPNSFKKKMSEIQTGKNNSNWKGGYSKRGIPTYDLYAPRIEWCEEVRRNKEDPNVLEVKCFKCNKWFIPVKQSVVSRIQFLKGDTNIRGERRFYCSDECRSLCSVYNMRAETLMKRDAIRAGRLPWIELEREVQPQLRKMVSERDGYKCVKCGNKEKLQCHHIYPVNVEPLLSADIDNCITLCKECHVKVHKEIDGCRYDQLHLKEC